MKMDILDERNQEKWDMFKWITFSSVITGFLLICAFFALLIRRFKDFRNFKNFKFLDINKKTEEATKL